MKKMNGMLAVACIAAMTACNSGKRATAEELIGRWNIVEVSGEPVKSDKAFFEFVKEDNTLRLHGNAGCNLINTETDLNEEKPATLSFSVPRVTMMACPDLETEDKILRALENVTQVKHGKTETHLHLADKEGKNMLTLEKAAP
ncbi:META domain-containing protein [Tannerella sp.]|uniref:META domain-containing protein n=1 Tax=Tannerella sp. TaxID=2382127 RepID=UPI0026DD3AF2|nr:META domain-containing protein [Tannerella sp.]MDO4703587.1 META domain-containing protein [Tannerella sp.]